MCGSLVEMQCFPGENKDQDGQENIGCDNTNNHSPHYFLRHIYYDDIVMCVR